MTKGENCIKRGKCKNNHCSSVSNSVWTDLISKGYIMKLLYKCSNLKCNCQKIITFTPHQYMLEGGSIKLIYRKFLKERKQHGIVLLNQV